MSNDARKGPVTELLERLSELEAVAKSSHEELLRAMADFDNYRRRAERDIEQRQRLALEGLLVDILPVLDNFDLALRHAGDGQPQEAVVRGIELIKRQLCDVLARHGLEQYSVCGQQFDPRRAEAISFVHSDEHAANTVVEEACKGYECRGRVIRPARVVVARPRQTSGAQVAVQSEDSEIGEPRGGV